MKNFLDKKGLSMTQAQAISNLCNQASNEIVVALSRINNCKKVINFKDMQLVSQSAMKMPSDIGDTLKKLGAYRSCQAFLMEQIKAKDSMMEELKRSKMVPEVEEPTYPQLVLYKPIQIVDEKWGWDKLTAEETAEYLEAEAKAAVIGQFIHKGGKLDVLRKELPSIEPLEWFVEPGQDGKAHPVTVSVHHIEEDLWKTHQELAAQHRDLEQRVNYFKAKVKNLVTARNAEIAKENASMVAKTSEENSKLMNDYNKAMEEYRAVIRAAMEIFESSRLEKLKEASALRIQVPTRFQEVVDEFLKDMKTEE